MISFKELIGEDRSGKSIDRGCLMAMIPKNISEKLVEFGKKIIPDQNLYIDGDEYGRETESHITIRYGFTRDLNELEIRRILQGYKPFTVSVVGIDKFGNDPKYDVVKFEVESPILKELNQISGIYPNETKFPDYHAHITLAYVKKNMFPHLKMGMRMSIPIKTVCYSPIRGAKTCYDLGEDYRNGIQETKTSTAIPSQMYHGTIESLANRIWKYGLEPRSNRNYAWAEKGVYLTTNLSVAKHFGEAGNAPPEDARGFSTGHSSFGTMGREDVIVLVISTKGLNPKKFRIDPNAQDSLIYLGTIPAKNIIDWKKSEGVWEQTTPPKINETYIVEPKDIFSTGYITLYHGTTLDIAKKAKRGELKPRNLKQEGYNFLVNELGIDSDIAEEISVYSSRKEPSLLYFSPNPKQAAEYAKASTEIGGEYFFDLFRALKWDKWEDRISDESKEKAKSIIKTKHPSVVTITVPLSMVLTHPHWNTPIKDRIRDIIRRVKKNQELYTHTDLDEMLKGMEVFVGEAIPAKYVQRVDLVK